MTLNEAAIDVLNEQQETMKALLETEQLKDLFISKISQIKNRNDVDVIDENILQLKIKIKI